MRNPSIHIKKSDLQKIVKDKGEELGIKGIKLDEFIKECSNYICSNRSYLLTTKEIKKKAGRSAKADDRKTNLFRTVLVFTRQAAGHKNFSEYKHGTKADILREAADAAVQFCHDFEYELPAGFKRVCEFMVDRMGSKFRLNKFRYMMDDLYNEEEQKEDIENIGSETIDQIRQTYGEITGLELESKDYDHYFAELHRALEGLQITAELYIKEVAENFKHFDRIPMPKDLVNSKMKDRLLQAQANLKEVKSPGTKQWVEELKKQMAR